jgi:hypothetical protein
MPAHVVVLRERASMTSWFMVEPCGGRKQGRQQRTVHSFSLWATPLGERLSLPIMSDMYSFRVSLIACLFAMARAFVRYELFEPQYEVLESNAIGLSRLFSFM